MVTLWAVQEQPAWPEGRGPNPLEEWVRGAPGGLARRGEALQQLLLPRESAHLPEGPAEPQTLVLVRTTHLLPKHTRCTPSSPTPPCTLPLWGDNSRPLPILTPDLPAAARQPWCGRC